MHLFFEEDGGFKVGTVLEAGGAAETTSYHIELPSGRRAKIKAASVLFKFVQPAPGELLRAAQALAESIDLAFLWEVAPQDEFDVAALGADYFGAAPTPVQTAALLMRLHGAPMYFRRKGKGRYRPAPEGELKAALAGLEKRQQLAAQQAALTAELVAGRLPAGWGEAVGAAGSPARAAFLLFKPDKNSIEFKALDQAAKQLQRSPVRLLCDTGAFGAGPSGNAKEVHRARFMVEWFPRGAGFDAAAAATDAAGTRAQIGMELPIADVQAFSIDDTQTTEIDDAFSVQWPGAQTLRIGIHIAAPGLAFQPGDALDAIARRRLSTVYMPGEKITMLPDAVVEAFTLGEGRPRVALSLYADFDAAGGACVRTETRLERVPVAANLRHDQLDELVTEATLGDDDSSFPFKRELQALWQLARHLSAGREAMRGKPEPRNRADFNFRIETEGGVERVRIDQRRRDAPLDRIVAEWMIFANSTWGRALAEAGIPGIYRTQTSFSRPGARQSSVRMTTVPAEHIGLGVSHYAWSSSPLRRYIDLVNQWQLIAWVRAQEDRAARPPFERNSAELFAIIGAFDTAYAAYAEVQGNLERYWSLRWLAQEGLVGSGRHVNAVVLRNEAVRFADVPLVSRMAGIAHLAPGTHVELEVLAIDEIELTAELRLAVAHVEEAAEDVDALEESAGYDETALASAEDVPVDGVPTDAAHPLDAEMDEPDDRNDRPASGPPSSEPASQ